MSYEPTIIIKKTDLDKYSDIFEQGSKNETIKYLAEIFKNSDIAIIDKIQLIICQPELTSFNKRIRKQLDKWEIQYSLIN